MDLTWSLEIELLHIWSRNMRRLAWTSCWLFIERSWMFISNRLTRRNKHLPIDYKHYISHRSYCISHIPTDAILLTLIGGSDLPAEDIR